MKQSYIHVRRAPALAIARLLCIAALGLAACGGNASPVPSAPPVAATHAPVAAATQPAAVAAVTQPPTASPAIANQAAAPTKAAEPTLTQAPAATAAPAATQAPAAAPVSTDATNCITCHTDQAALQKLAKEVAPAEKLSEGEG